MKLKKIFIYLMIVIIFVGSTININAVKVNDGDFKKDDIIVYSLMLKKQAKPMAAFNLVIAFDEKNLEITKSTNSNIMILSPATNNSFIYNYQNDGIIRSNAANGVNGFNIDTDLPLMKVFFKVIGEGDNQIKHEIIELFDLDIVEINKDDIYTKVELLEDVAIDNSGNVEDNTNNTQNSTGDDNTSSSESTNSNQNISQEETNSNSVNENNNLSNSSDTSNENNDDNGNNNILIIFGICIIVVLLISIFILLVYKRKGTK